MNVRLIGLLAALAIGAAMAQPHGKSTDYALYDGAIRFSAPSAWPAIMRKTEGTPQFVAFLIKDPADAGGSEPARVSVEAKRLDDAAAFPALFQTSVAKIKQSPGYEARGDAPGAHALHYVALDGKQRYEYQEAWRLDADILVHVRCARALLSATNPDWMASYEAGCAEVLRGAGAR